MVQCVIYTKYMSVCPHIGRRVDDHKCFFVLKDKRMLKRESQTNLKVLQVVFHGQDKRID